MQIQRTYFSNRNLWTRLIQHELHCVDTWILCWPNQVIFILSFIIDAFIVLFKSMSICLRSPLFCLQSTRKSSIILCIYMVFYCFFSFGNVLLFFFITLTLPLPLYTFRGWSGELPYSVELILKGRDDLFANKLPFSQVLLAVVVFLMRCFFFCKQ